jgi:hypothetical protein
MKGIGPGQLFGALLGSNHQCGFIGSFVPGERYLLQNGQPSTSNHRNRRNTV